MITTSNEVFRTARAGGSITGVRVTEKAGKLQTGTICSDQLQRTRSGMLRVAVRFDADGSVRWVNYFEVVA